MLFLYIKANQPINHSVQTISTAKINTTDNNTNNTDCFWNGMHCCGVVPSLLRSEVPETLEGKILHDAHVLEGGKPYLVVKTLITGSVRGQSLLDTLKYMEGNVLDKNSCYLPETIPLCEEMNEYTNRFF